jgi:tripartite-type tricarboxylate transporter receptor subunit TctC
MRFAIGGCIQYCMSYCWTDGGRPVSVPYFLIGRPLMIGRIFAAALALVGMANVGVWAQDWPNRPVRVVVPFAAGGSTDVAARLVADYLSRSLGQQVFIENRTGANGNIGIDSAARSESDGYTILIAPDAVVSNPHLYKVKYDPLKDLTPVVQISRQPIVLAAHPSIGVKTVAELIALAKREPGVRYALGSGVGSAQHMVGEWFARIAGIQLQAVAYRGGGQAINDLVAGHVKLGSLGSTPVIPHYQAGTLLILAQTTEARSKSLPEVPTYQEAGINGLVLDQWVGVFVPAGTPAAIIARINSEVNKALADRAVKDALDKSAQEPVGGTAEAFSKRVQDEFSKYASLTKDLGMKVQ